MRMGAAMAAVLSLGAGCAGEVDLVKQGDGVVPREGVYDADTRRPPASPCKVALEPGSLGLKDVEVSVTPRANGVGPLLWISFKPGISCPPPAAGSECRACAFTRVSVLDRPNLAGTLPQSEGLWWTGLEGSCKGRATVLWRGTYNNMGNTRFFGPLRLLVENGGDRASAKVLEVDYGPTAPAEPPQAPAFDRAEIKAP